MDDPAPPPTDDAVTRDDPASFAHDLQALRASVGAPSYARLARRSGIPRSTLHDGLRGERLASRETVVAVVGALGGDVETWSDRWARLRLEAEVHPDRSVTRHAAVEAGAPVEPASEPEPESDPPPESATALVRVRRSRRGVWVVSALAVLLVAGGTTMWVVRSSCDTGEQYRITASGDLNSADGDTVERLEAGQTVIVIDKSHRYFKHRYLAISDRTGQQGYVDESKIEFDRDVCR